MLPGSMYPKKTYGRSLFIGEFKHVVAANVETKDEIFSTPPLKKEESKVDTPHDEVVQNEGENNTEEVNVSRTLTYEFQEEEQKQKSDEVKLVWKNSSGQVGGGKNTKSLTSKAFFTPNTTDDQTNDTEQVVDLPVIKEEAIVDMESANKVSKKKRLSIGTLQANIANRKPLLQRHQKFPNFAKGKAPILKDQKKTTQAQAQKTEDDKTKESKIKEREEEESDHEELPDNQKETSSHTEFSTQDYSSPDRKSIIIKPVDFSGYAEKLKDGETETDAKPLEPNAVEDMKRDLAEKGIIAFPPDLPQHRQTLIEKTDGEDPDEEVQDAPEMFHEDDDEQRDSEANSDEENSDMEANTEQSSDLNEEKMDRNREGFKTNKSFEIRRLQAKAEREKEKKKRAIFGSRFSKIKARSDHLSRGLDQAVRLPLKSVLKPATPPGKDDPSKSILKDLSPRQLKSRASVRIRDPEYDYQEYTDVEWESDSGDSIRPNTSLSFEDFSIPSDVSSDSSSLGTNAGDEAFRNMPFSDEDNSSYEGSDIHELYDELDNLSPSRVGYFGGARDGKSRDSRRERVESSTSRATARSSLHLMAPDPNHSLNQQAAYFRPYNEKPMHLFDAMRHDRYIHSSESKRFKTKNKHAPIEEEDFQPTSRQKETSLTFVNEKSNQTKKGSKPYSSKQKSIPLGLDQTNHPANGEAGKSFKRKSWTERIEKFFETSYANRKLTKKFSTNANSSSQDSQIETSKR